MVIWRCSVIQVKHSYGMSQSQTSTSNHDAQPSTLFSGENEEQKPFSFSMHKKEIQKQKMFVTQSKHIMVPI